MTTINNRAIYETLGIEEEHRISLFFSQLETRAFGNEIVLHCALLEPFFENDPEMVNTFEPFTLVFSECERLVWRKIHDPLEMELAETSTEILVHEVVIEDNLCHIAIYTDSFFEIGISYKQMAAYKNKSPI